MKKLLPLLTLTLLACTPATSSDRDRQAVRAAFRDFDLSITEHYGVKYAVAVHSQGVAICPVPSPSVPLEDHQRVLRELERTKAMVAALEAELAEWRAR